MLNLKSSDMAEYLLRLDPLEQYRQAAIVAGNTHAARKWRRVIDQLDAEFAALEPPPPPPTAWERELAMSLESSKC